MSTLTKAESSRINGAKSRGPVTSEGKARSAMNSVRHGLLAKAICLNIERPEVFQETIDVISDRIQTRDQLELRYVEQAAMAQFRLERMVSAETAMFVLQMDTQAPEVAKKYARVDPPTRFAIAVKGLADDSSQIQLMLRYQNSLIRQRDSALKQIYDLRVRFPQPNEPTEPEEVPQPVESTSPAPVATDRVPEPNEPTAKADGRLGQQKNDERSALNAKLSVNEHSEPADRLSDPQNRKERPLF